MTRRRRRRRSAEDAQAVLETALVVPLFLLLALLFAGAALVGQALLELRAATTVATMSAFAAPAGAPAQALANVQDSFQQSTADALLSSKAISCPIGAGGENQYLYSGAPVGTVSCQGEATVSFAGTIIGLAWRWPLSIHQSAQLPVPPYRQCAVGEAQC